MSSIGNSAIGISAVADIGIASVIHQIPIKRVTAAVFQAASLNPSGAGNHRIIKKAVNPVIKPRNFPLLFIIEEFAFYLNNLAAPNIEAYK
jgi:hypothetical protein